MIVVAVLVPPPPPAGQTARDREVEGVRLIGALSNSESRTSTTKQVVHTVEHQLSRASAASQVVRTAKRQQGRSGRSSRPGGERWVQGHFYLCLCFVLPWSDTVGNIAPETATKQSVVATASIPGESQQQLPSLRQSSSPCR